jgi:hypothetical protein
MKTLPHRTTQTGVPPGTHAEPQEAEIQKAAYYLWQSKGCPEGCDLDLWLEARELLRHRLAPGTAETGRPPGVRTAKAAKPPAKAAAAGPETIHFPPAHETIPAHSAVAVGDNAHLDFRHTR